MHIRSSRNVISSHSYYPPAYSYSAFLKERKLFPGSSRNMKMKFIFNARAAVKARCNINMLLSFCCHIV